jgi:hypothetical protein
LLKEILVKRRRYRSKTYSVTANGTSSYVFNEGLTNSNNQTLPLKGRYLHFNMSTAGHPFFINTVQGTGTANAYASGLQIMELYQEG